jgi:hypothetical protein
MKKPIFVYTEPKGTFPAFINMTEQDDGSVRIILRNRRASLASEMILPKDVFENMHKAMSEGTPTVKPTTGLKISK